ncbi:MAG: hypothetical protein MJ237_05590 [bacterium]|nr:hypothetical protein [bacterium]
MEQVNLLKFLNSIKLLHTVEYAVCDLELKNLLEFVSKDCQFIQEINLGVIYTHEITPLQYTLVDGFNRILSLSLLLHAICECYKKTSEKNDNAINTIRQKYLLNKTQTKLRMNKKLQTIYDKIIYGERLSGNEKRHPMFVLLHKIWSQIKENELQAATIFKTLQKFSVIKVETKTIEPRDLYYSLNKDHKNINPILLMDNYLNDTNIKDSWKEFKDLFDNKRAEITAFFEVFFRSKFDYREFNDSDLFGYFKNYFETMIQYQTKDSIVSNLKHAAKLYKDIINVNMPNDALKKALIKIKMHNGEDTYAYLLNIYDDYINKNISEFTFLEILSTIDEYLQNRLKTPNNVSFNELIQYLNAFITYK